MKNKSFKKRVIFLITCLIIIAIGICIPIVGTTLASNDTKASPTSPSSNPIETGVKVDKNGSLINLSTDFDGPSSYLDNKYMSTYSKPKSISISYNGCFDSKENTTKLINGVSDMHTGPLRSIVLADCDEMLQQFYNPTKPSGGNMITSIGVFGAKDYYVEITYTATDIYKSINPYNDQYLIASDIKLSFLNSPTGNVYVPSNIIIKSSLDGKNYYDWGGSTTITQDKASGFSVDTYTISRSTYAKVKYIKFYISQKAYKNLVIDKIYLLSRANVSTMSDSNYDCRNDLTSYILENVTTAQQFNGFKISFTKGTRSVLENQTIATGSKSATGICSDGMIKSITAYSGLINNWQYDKYVINGTDYSGFNYSENMVSINTQISALLENGHYATINGFSKTSNNITIPDYLARANFVASNRKTSGYLLGSPVVEITSKALANKGNINSITIGRNVHKIASDAFTGTNAKYIYVEGNNTSYYVKNNILYDKTGKVIYKGTASTGGEIAEPSKTVNELIKKAGYLIDIAGNEKLIRNIKPCTLISDFVAQFSGKTVKINGVVSTSLKDNYIKTGDKLTIDGLQFVALVWGDGNGDGKVNAADYILARRAILNTVELNTYQTRALCVTGTSKITTADYIKIRKYIMGEITL